MTFGLRCKCRIAMSCHIAGKNILTQQSEHPDPPINKMKFKQSPALKFRSRLAKALPASLGLTVTALSLLGSQFAQGASYTWSRGVASTAAAPFAWNDAPVGGETAGTSNWTVANVFPNAAGDVAIITPGAGANAEFIGLNQNIT